jgi:nucleoside-triphosphatase
VLAHIEVRGPPRVGRYGVDLATFERVALRAFADVASGSVVVIDELGKMELFSERFRAAVLELFGAPVPVAATVMASRHQFTDTLKRNPSTDVIAVTRANRDTLPAELVPRLTANLPGL